MTDPIEKIPAEARWQIATKGLTGAAMAVANALRQAVGEEKYNEVMRALWYQAGKGVKEFIEAFGLPVRDARQIEEAAQLASLASMGPEFKYEVVEASQDRCVARVSKCPWYERHKEQGMGFDLCTFGHGSWGEGFVESANPDFIYSVSKSMARGDSYCEVIIERKK
jgi:predicted hydrocarbon binding protein